MEIEQSPGFTVSYVACEQSGEEPGARWPRQNRENLPHQKQKEQRGQEVVALVVEQVVDDAVVPAVQVTHVGHGEPGRAQEKIVQAPEGWRLYVYHLSLPTVNLLSHNAVRMGKRKGGGPPKGVCATVSDMLPAGPIARRASENRERALGPAEGGIKLI